MLIRSIYTGASISRLEGSSGELAGIASVCALCSTGSALAELTYGLRRMMKTIKSES